MSHPRHSTASPAKWSQRGFTSSLVVVSVHDPDFYNFTAFFLCFKDGVSLCLSGCLKTHCVDQADLSSETHLYLPPRDKIKGVGHHTQLLAFLYNFSSAKYTLLDSKVGFIHLRKNRLLYLLSYSKLSLPVFLVICH